MMPNYKPDDLVLVSKIPYLISSPAEEDVILFKHRSKVLIKRIKKIRAGKLQTSGDNEKDSLAIKPIIKEQILGKVLFRIKSSL